MSTNTRLASHARISDCQADKCICYASSTNLLSYALPSRLSQNMCQCLTTMLKKKKKSSQITTCCQFTTDTNMAVLTPPRVDTVAPLMARHQHATGGLPVKVAYTMVMDEVASTTSLVLRQYVTFHVDNIFSQFAYVIVEAFVTESKFDFAPLLKNHQNLPSSNLS